MTHIYHHAKFRWTEHLTSKFIQLRKENGKLFTGRKYSAQAGWEHILRQMRQEFPTIMADVHYRVLKKKWSNLLQQYKELKNPVHGDKNRADDVSWPFYGAIDEVVLGQDHRKSMKQQNAQQMDDIEEEVDPHEFLCVSVTPSDDQSSPPHSPIDSNYSRDHKHFDDTPIQVEEFSISRESVKLESPSISVRNLANLRRTENQSRMTHQQLQIIRTAVNHAKRPRQPVVREGKKMKRTLTGFQRSRDDTSSSETQRDVVEKLNEFLDYTKQRDEDNRLIMLRILAAVEKIADKLK